MAWRGWVVIGGLMSFGCVSPSADEPVRSAAIENPEGGLAFSALLAGLDSDVRDPASLAAIGAARGAGVTENEFAYLYECAAAVHHRREALAGLFADYPAWSAKLSLAQTGFAEAMYVAGGMLDYTPEIVSERYDAALAALETMLETAPSERPVADAFAAACVQYY